MANTKLSTTAKPVEPMLEHEIRILAYDIYERRGALTGMRSMTGFRQSTRYYASEGTVGLAKPSERAYR